MYIYLFRSSLFRLAQLYAASRRKYSVHLYVSNVKYILLSIYGEDELVNTIFCSPYVCCFLALARLSCMCWFLDVVCLLNPPAYLSSTQDKSDSRLIFWHPISWLFEFPNLPATLAVDSRSLSLDSSCAASRFTISLLGACRMSALGDACSTAGTGAILILKLGVT